MATRLFRKVKSKISSPRPTSPHVSPPPATPQRSILSETSVASLQERLWNQAYDGLKTDEPGIVEAYEKFLSTELQDGGSPCTTTTENQIEPASQGRWQQMGRAVQVGLQRTEKDTAIKQKISDGIKVASPVKALIGKAVQAAPEAAVAWVGVCFALEMLSNPLTEPSINLEGIAYVVSRMDWYWNLADLLLDKEGAGLAFAGLRDQLEKNVVQLYQKLLLYQMKSVCLYHRKRIGAFFRDMVMLDDWRGQLNGIREVKAAIRSDSEQYNSQQVRDRLQTLASTAEHQYTELQGITSTIQHQTRRQEEMQQDTKDRECLKDLSVTDPCHDKARIQSTKGGLLEDSYRWILSHADFLQWRDDLHSRLLWIKGDPGKGKTMLLCGVIDELNKTTAEANQPAYFFCQATDERLNSATAVLRGLIYFLIDQEPPLISYVRAKYDKAGQSLFKDANAWFALSQILSEMLADSRLEDKILIVDALDECGTGRAQLLDFIIARTSSSSHVKWIISSRNWPDIEEKMDNATQKITLHLELNEDSVSNAVRAYIRHKAGELARLKKYDDTTRDTIQRHLTSKANDTFLWVALVYKELVHPDTRYWHALEVLETLPSGLNALYDRMMGQIGQSRDAKLCIQILAVASVVYRPISLEELTSIVELPAHPTDDSAALEILVGSCGSFLTLRGGHCVLCASFGKGFPTGQSTRPASMEVLSRTLRRDIYDLAKPGFSIDEVVPPVPDPLATIRYSCTHWVDHLQNANPAEKLTEEHLKDGGLVDTFLQQKYLYWLEAMSLQRSMSQAVLAIQKLETLVARPGAQLLADLVRDARRFVLSYKAAVESAPLQLYASALVFSPTRTLVRRLFQKEAPSWIISAPAIETGWSACVQTLEGHSGWVTSVAFSADGLRLATASNDKTVKIWDAVTGVCVQTLKGHGRSVTSVAFTADGLQLASASRDETVKIWDAATGVARAQTLEGHGDRVTSFAFTADGQRLASASHDKTVKIWDTVTGACVQTLAVDRYLSSLSFDATDTSRLVTDIGVLALDLPRSIHPPRLLTPQQDFSFSGYGIGYGGTWIVKDSERMLWLPPEYRPSLASVTGSIIAIGCSIASSLTSVITVTAQSIQALYQTVQGFQDKPRTVRQLEHELKSLDDVLGSLHALAVEEGTSFVPLELPLRQCGQACVDFKALVLKCTTHSDGTRSSVRDWARLRYMDNDLRGFTEMLAGYKSSISVALADANLRSSTVPRKVLNEYKDMIRTTTLDLEDRLEDISLRLRSFTLLDAGDPGGFSVT
ncbi:nwd1 protein [Verticillium dahliae]